VCVLEGKRRFLVYALVRCELNGCVGKAFLGVGGVLSWVWAWNEEGRWEMGNGKW
jgi:hypothetical protein